MTRPRKHHYIPQWLSKRWITPPEEFRIFGVSKERNGAIVHGWTATPKAVCWERDEYTVVNRDMEKDASLESDFYGKMDNQLNIAVGEIVNLVGNNIVPRIDEQSRMALAHSLVIDASRRNPDQKSVIMEAAKQTDFKTSILKRLGDTLSDTDAILMYDKATSDPKNMKQVTNKSRRSLLPDGVRSLTEQPFQYLLPPKGKPFILGNPLVRPLAEFIVPIDPYVAIVFRRSVGPLIANITAKSRQMINQDIFEASTRTIATNPDYLRVLARKQGKSLTFSADTDRPKNAKSIHI